MRTVSRRRLLTAALGGTVVLPQSNIASLFAPAPKGSSQNMAYRQGVILTFDANTLENTVLVDEATLTNLPLLGVGEAQLLTPGSVVGLAVVGVPGGGKTLAILGRFVIPNTDDAADAVGLLNSQIYAAFLGDLEACSSASLGDLATVGPEVTVPVGVSGRVLIIAGALHVTSGLIQAGGYTAIGQMAVWLSGANIYQPSALQTNGIMEDGLSAQLGVGTSMSSRGNPVIVSVLENLTPGDTTFTLKYARQITGAGTSFFLNRAITVIRL